MKSPSCIDSDSTIQNVIFLTSNKLKETTELFTNSTHRHIHGTTLLTNTNVC